jgi:hypothetical protein
MDAHYLAMLQYSAGVPIPLRISVRAPDGTSRQVEVAAPFALVGRGEGCDVRIPESTASFRHVYLQAIGHRVACIDLQSVTGIQFRGPDCHGWLSSEHVFEVGGWSLNLTDSLWTADETLKPPLDFRPRDEHRAEYGTLPIVDLELLNTSKKGERWPVNRIITLLGRDERCRITIKDERLSRAHCSLLLLPSGLWVIDLLGKGGIQVDGQPCRCMLLSEGHELKVGPYLLGARYPQMHSGAESAAGRTAGTGADFLTRHNRIFTVEIYHDTLIVMPLGDSQAFLFKDIQVEASRVMDVIKFHHFRHVVLDFSRAEMAGHILMESLSAFCKAVPGKSALCGANAKTFQILKSNPLLRISDHYATRQDALQAVYLP